MRTGPVWATDTPPVLANNRPCYADKASRLRIYFPVIANNRETEIDRVNLRKSQLIFNRMIVIQLERACLRAQIRKFPC